MGHEIAFFGDVRDGDAVDRDGPRTPVREPEREFGGRADQEEAAFHVGLLGLDLVEGSHGERPGGVENERQVAGRLPETLLAGGIGLQRIVQVGRDAVFVGYQPYTLLLVGPDLQKPGVFRLHGAAEIDEPVVLDRTVGMQDDDAQRTHLLAVGADGAKDFGRHSEHDRAAGGRCRVRRT